MYFRFFRRLEKKHLNSGFIFRSLVGNRTSRLIMTKTKTYGKALTAFGTCIHNKSKNNLHSQQKQKHQISPSLPFAVFASQRINVFWECLVQKNYSLFLWRRIYVIFSMKVMSY